jgi:hypothetical protein
MPPCSFIPKRLYSSLRDIFPGLTLKAHLTAELPAFMRGG